MKLNKDQKRAWIFEMVQHYAFGVRRAYHHRWHWMQKGFFHWKYAYMVLHGYFENGSRKSETYVLNNKETKS